MYASIKKGLGIHLATERDFSYYPTRNFHQQAADYLVSNWQKVMLGGCAHPLHDLLHVGAQNYYGEE